MNSELKQLNELIEEPEALSEASNVEYRVFECNSCGKSCFVTIPTGPYRPTNCVYDGHECEYAEVIDEHSPDFYEFDLFGI